MSESMFAKKAKARSQKVSGDKTPERQARVKLTLSMTESDRAKLERLARTEGVTMATYVHMWLAEQE